MDTINQLKQFVTANLNPTVTKEQKRCLIEVFDSIQEDFDVVEGYEPSSRTLNALEDFNHSIALIEPEESALDEDDEDDEEDELDVIVYGDEDEDEEDDVLQYPPLDEDEEDT